MSIVRRAAGLLTLLALVPGGPAAGQAAGGSVGSPGAAAGADVTAGEIRETVRILAADSMRGRDTPSPELEQAARWTAARFEAVGVKPGLGPDGFLQWYPLTIVDPARARRQHAALTGPDGTRELVPGEEFVAVPTGEATRAEGPLASWRPEEGPTPEGAVALVRADPSTLRDALSSVRSALESADTPGAVIAVRGSGEWFGRVASFLSRRQVSLGEPDMLEKPVALVRASVLPRGAGDGADGEWSIELVTDATLTTGRAPNVVGWVEGSDPELKTEYVVVTAHLDHLGVGEAVGGDSIYNGADDDATGVAAVMELAEAFAAEPARRSVVLMAVSGEEKGLYGSRWYAEHPVFPLERTVANVNIDMIGRNWRDTVAAIGAELSTLGETARRVAGAHPELDVAVVGDRWPEERYFQRSDHYHFARRGVPALFFFSGTHEDYHGPGDEADEIDYVKTARIVRLIHLVVREVADDADRPTWDPEARKRVVGSGDGG